MLRERLSLFALALAVVAVIFVAMHGEHYRRRRMQLLEAEVEALRRIVLGEH